jgi:hypothetical protein
VFFPESLVRLSARDDQVTWLDPLFTNVQISVANALAEPIFIVPDPRALILTHMEAEFDPGAGQNIVTARVWVAPPTASAPFANLRHSLNALAADVNLELTWDGQILIPPLWRVIATGIFNAGVAANLSRVTLAGMLIPVANVQRT